VNAEEYCISEGWAKAPAGKTLDCKGHPLLIKLKARSKRFTDRGPYPFAMA